MIDWAAFREKVECGEPPEEQIRQIQELSEEYMRTPEGQAEILAFAAELRAMDDAEVARTAELYQREERIMEQTTEGITRADVEDAMAYLGICNPKPEIPIDTTVSGHDIVAVARRFRNVANELIMIRAALTAAGLAV